MRGFERSENSKGGSMSTVEWLILEAAKVALAWGLINMIYGAPDANSGGGGGGAWE